MELPKEEAKTIITLDSTDKKAIITFGLIFIALSLYAGSEYANSKVCESKGGKFIYSQCLKKELFLD